MDKKTITLINNENGKRVDLPLLDGTAGPQVVDVTSLYKQTGLFTFDPGFMATGSCRSAITFIDGEQGILRYRGYPIEQLAEQSTFLEVAYLLLYGELKRQNRLP